MRLHPPSNLSGILQRLLDSRRVALGVLLLISMSTALPLTASTPHGGALISPDSVHYLAASQSLLRWGDYLSYDDRVYTTWTPLYPTLLAGVSAVARVFNTPLINALRAWQLVTYCAARSSSRQGCCCASICNRRCWCGLQHLARCAPSHCCASAPCSGQSRFSSCSPSAFFCCWP